MHFLNTIASLAAFTALLTPVFSVPIAEPDVETTSVVVKRGAGELTDTAQTCHDRVKQKCDEIVVKIDTAVDGKIDVKVANLIIIDIEAIVILIENLRKDLDDKCKDGKFKLPDVKACVAIVLLIVKLIIAILIKIKACLSVHISILIFKAIVLKLLLCLKVVIVLCLDLCHGKKGGVPVLELVVQLNACLQDLVKVCGDYGAHA